MIGRSLAASALAVGVTLGSSAMAQPAEGSKVAAEALFEEGRKLTQEGNFAVACPKFAESERLDPSPGTLLNLANCWEKVGRAATAWATYREAASVASGAGRSQELRVAQRHADALAAKLARVTITVANPPEGLSVTRDGVAIARAEWGAPIPVDTGTHTISAKAMGFKEWTSTIDVAHDGVESTVVVPGLEPLPSPPPPPSPSVQALPPPPVAPPVTGPPPPRDPPQHEGWPALRTVGAVVGGLGVVGLAVAGGFALSASSKNSASHADCLTTSPNECNASGVNLRNEALSAGNAATVALGVGAAAIVVGAVLWIAAPSERASVSVGIAPTLGGASFTGWWR